MRSPILFFVARIGRRPPSRVSTVTCARSAFNAEGPFNTTKSRFFARSFARALRSPALDSSANPTSTCRSCFARPHSHKMSGFATRRSVRPARPRFLILPEAARAGR